MPDPKTCGIGDRIRILRVPTQDLQQRERELAEGAEFPGWTADIVERIIEPSPIVRFLRVAEYRASGSTLQ